MSWDPSTTTTTLSSTVDLAAWSQCSRFIAIAQGDIATADILDSATLQRLQTLESPQGTSALHRALAFSPDSRALTCSSGGGCDPNRELFIVSWDLQTGGVAGLIRRQGLNEDITGNHSITYSADGKMIGVFYWYYTTTMIIVYDIVSGVHLHSHSLASIFSNGGPVSTDIWTHGGSLRFATAELTTITIWEIGFVSGTTPTEVEAISTPDNIGPAAHHHIDYNDPMVRVRLLPASRGLVITYRGEVLLWDTQNSRTLLRSTDSTKRPPRTSYSSDGRFFACGITGSEIHLWKDSPAGYVLHGMLVSGADYSNPLLSPDGESIFAFGGSVIRLWRTKNFTAPPIVSARAPQHVRNFILDFSPDGALAAVARQDDSAVTVLDLKSGVPRLTIDTDGTVYGLKVIGNIVVVIGAGGIIAWKPPAGDCVPGARASFEDNIWTINFNSWWKYSGRLTTASVSSDLRHVALTNFGPNRNWLLDIYSTSTRYLGNTITSGGTSWFTPDGHSVWCAADSGEAEVWKIGSGGDSGHTRPRLICDASVVDVEHPPEGYPWGSSRGYKTTDGGWILSPGGERLFLLPPPWRSHPVRRVWNGQFLALLHGALSEPVILELEP